MGIFAFGTASADVFTIPDIGPGVCVALCDGAATVPVLPDIPIVVPPTEVLIPDIPTDVPSTEVLIPDIPTDVALPAVTAPPADIGAAPLPSGSPELVLVPSFDGERGFEVFKDDFQIIGAMQSRAPSDLTDFRDLSDPIVRQKGLLRFLDAGAWMLVERGSLESAAAEYAKAADIAAQDPELRESLKTSIEARYDDAVRTGKDLRVLEVLARILVALDPDDAAARADLETLQARIADAGGAATAGLAPGSATAASPGVVDPNDVAGGFQPAGEGVVESAAKSSGDTGAGGALIAGDTPALLREAAPTGVVLSEGATPNPPQGVSLAQLDPETEARIGEGVFTDRDLQIWEGRGWDTYTEIQTSKARYAYLAQTSVLALPMAVGAGAVILYGVPTVGTLTLGTAMTLAALKFGKVMVSSQGARDKALAEGRSARQAEGAQAQTLAVDGAVELFDNPVVSAAKDLFDLASHDSAPEAHKNSLGRVFEAREAR